VSVVEKFKDATIGFSGYPRLAKDRSSAFAFMALLLLIAVGIAGLIATVQTQRLMDQVARQIQQGPNFVLRDGEFVFDGPMPYRADYGGVLRVIVDTTGETDPESLKGEPPGSILITRTQAYQVDFLGTLRATSFPAMPVEVTRDDLADLVRQVYRWVPAIYAGVYLLQLGIKTVDAVILASLAVAYASVLKRRVTMAFGFKLALYAMSLPNLLQWVFPAFRTYTLGGFVLWWGLTLLYLLQGLKACAEAGLLEPTNRHSIAS